METQAEAAKESAKQPDEIGKVGNLSGLVTSSAFAFGQFGGAGGREQEERAYWKDMRAKEEKAREDRKAMVELLRQAVEQARGTNEQMGNFGIFAT